MLNVLCRNMNGVYFTKIFQSIFKIQKFVSMKYFTIDSENSEVYAKLTREFELQR